MYSLIFPSNFRFLQILQKLSGQSKKHIIIHIIYYLWIFQYSIRFALFYYCVKHQHVETLLKIDFLFSHIYRNGFTDPLFFLFYGILIIFYGHLYFNVYCKRNLNLWNRLDHIIVTSAAQYYSKNSQLDVKFNLQNFIFNAFKIKTLTTLKLIKTLYLKNVIQNLVYTKKSTTSSNLTLFLWLFFEFELQYIYLCKCL